MASIAAIFEVLCRRSVFEPLSVGAVIFGRVMSALRHRARLRQLGAELGVSQSAVSRWENGADLPVPQTVFRIEELLGCRPGSLSFYLGYVPVPPGYKVPAG